MPAMKNRELDLSEFPVGTVTEFTTLVCLACIFDIFTKQLGLAPRTAFSEIKRHTPEIEELTTRSAKRPYFDSDEKHPHCPYCKSAKRWNRARRTLQDAGAQLRQNGDMDGIFVFNPADKPQVDLVLSLVRPRQKRILSDDQRRVLADRMAVARNKKAA